MITQIKTIFNEIIVKHRLKVYENPNGGTITFYNDFFKLIFVNQNLDGWSLFFENSENKVEIDFFLKIYKKNNPNLLSNKEKNSINKSILILKKLSCLLIEDGLFFLNNNQIEIKKFLDWKEKNKKKIYEELFSDINWKPKSMM